MKKTMRSLILSAAMVMAGALPAFAQAGEAKNPETEKKAPLQQLIEGENALGFQILSLEARKKENVFLSPYSISSALALLLQCSEDGPQAEELRSLLGIPEFDNAALADAVKEQNERLTAYRSEPYTEKEAEELGMPVLEIANAVFLDDELKLLPAFDTLKTVFENAYAADMETMDLASDAAMKSINSWVNEKTRNMIPSLLSDPLPDAARMALMNALYFKGVWSAPFPEENTGKQSFFGVSGESEVDMMFQQDRFLYAETDDYKIIRLYYNFGFCMTVALPKDPKLAEDWTDAEELAQILDIEQYEADFREVALSMPKFEMNFSDDLTGLLQKLGVMEIFQPNLYDGLSDDPLQADAIYHKTAVKNSEGGTEAAAVTAILVDGAMIGEPEKPARMCIDHPFCFTIESLDDSVVLFAGCVFQL